MTSETTVALDSQNDIFGDFGVHDTNHECDIRLIDLVSLVRPLILHASVLWGMHAVLAGLLVSFAEMSLVIVYLSERLRFSSSHRSNEKPSATLPFAVLILYIFALMYSALYRG